MTNEEQAVLDTAIAWAVTGRYCDEITMRSADAPAYNPSPVPGQRTQVYEWDALWASAEVRQVAKEQGWEPKK